MTDLDLLQNKREMNKISKEHTTNPFTTPLAQNYANPGQPGPAGSSLLSALNDDGAQKEQAKQEQATFYTFEKLYKKIDILKKSP